MPTINRFLLESAIFKSYQGLPFLKHHRFLKAFESPPW